MRLCTFTLFLVAGLVLFVGCKDPLTQYMNDAGYTPLVPSPATATVGDMYLSANIARDNNPYLVMQSQPKLRDFALSLMKDQKDHGLGVDVTTLNVSSDRKYDLSADANIVGKVSIELTAKGARKYSIKLGGVKSYIVDEVTWRNRIVPQLDSANLGIKTDGKFVVRGLLWAKTLEYTFFDSSSARINLKTDESLSKAVKSQLGAGWDITNEGGLTITENAPRFVGYKLGVVQGEAINPVGGASPAELLVIDPAVLKEAIK